MNSGEDLLEAMSMLQVFSTQVGVQLHVVLILPLLIITVVS